MSGGQMQSQSQSGDGGAIEKTLALAGAAGTLTGLAADFAQPFGPAALYLFIGAAALAAAIAVVYLLARSARPRLRSPFIYVGALAVMSAAMVYFQEAAGEDGAERGALASALEPVAALQEQFGLIREDLAAIRDTSERAATAAEATAEGVERLAEGVAALGDLGGLVAEPETITDFYNNAQVYARRGDALSARRMYERAVAAGAEAVDLHLAYAELLKAQEGVLGAREIYAGVARTQGGNDGAQLAAATLAPAGGREAALRALVDRPEPFAPAWWEIARLYSADRLGTQSLADQTAERAALEAFEAADAQGAVYGRYLNKAAIEEIRAQAAARLAAYRSVAAGAAVTVTAAPSNANWIVTLSLPEAAREIRYRYDLGDGATDIRATGESAVQDPRLGGPAPNGFFTLPLAAERAALEIWYDDIRGAEQGPFEIAFDATAAHAEFARRTLEIGAVNWVEGRDFDGSYLVYFTALISYKCGLSEVRYAVEEGDAQSAAEPTEIWPLPDCDRQRPFDVGDGPLFLDLPAKPAAVAVQLVFADGGASEIRRFTFP